MPSFLIHTSFFPGVFKSLGTIAITTAIVVLSLGDRATAEAASNLSLNISSENNPSDYYGKLSSECNKSEDRLFYAGESSTEEFQKPGEYLEKHCTLTFIAGRKSNSIEEEYKLSFFDPIEVFHYSMLLKFSHSKTGSFYYMPPVLGNIRDRYIESWPFGDNLVFTTEISGIGYDLGFPWLTLKSDVGIIHFYQRYGGKFIGETEPYDPDREKIFGFSQMAVAARLKAVISKYGFNLIANFNRLFLRDKEKILRDIETTVHLRYDLFTAANNSIGVSGTYHHRTHNIRHDQQGFSKYTMVRGGVYLGF